MSASSPAVTIAERRTSDRVASSSSRNVADAGSVDVILSPPREPIARRGSGGRPDLADDLTARVPHRPAQEFLESRRQLIPAARPTVEARASRRETARAARRRRPSPRSRCPARGSRRECTPSAPILAMHATVGLLDEHRVESIGAADEKRARAHRVHDARRNLVAVADATRRDATRRAPCSRAEARRPRRRIRRPPDRCRLRSMPAHSATSLRQHRCTGGRAARSRTSASRRCGRARASPRACRSSCCAVRVSRAPGLAQQLHAARRQRIVRAAGEIALLHADVGRASPAAMRDVLRLAAVRRAGERELIVAPAQRVEAARFEERHDLEGLRARPPELTSAASCARGDERVVGARRPPRARGGAIRFARREWRRRPARAISCDRMASAFGARAAPDRCRALRSCPKPNRDRARRRVDHSPRTRGRPRRIAGRCRAERAADVDARDNESAAGNRREARELTNAWQSGGEQRRANRLAEQRQVDDVRGQIA